MGMIKTDTELENSKKLLKELLKRQENFSIQNKYSKIAQLGELSFAKDIEDQIKEYEEIKKGNIPEHFFYFENLGILLIALRIKNGMSQDNLAANLKVPVEEVVRDEFNEYYGKPLNKVKEILKIFNTDLLLKIKKER